METEKHQAYFTGKNDKMTTETLLSYLSLKAGCVRLVLLQLSVHLDSTQICTQELIVTARKLVYEKVN